MLKTIEMIEIEGKSYKVIEFDEIDQEKYCGFNYVTVNKINGKKYTGQKTWGGAKPETYLGSGTHLNRAINKYGRENFERFIIDLAQSQEELDEKETFYINEEWGNIVKSQDWYNIKDGAQNGGNSFAGFTDEEMKKTRKRISESLIVAMNRPEVRKKISIANKGKESWAKGMTFSEEHRKKLSEAHSGKILSEEHRKKLSEAHFGKILSKEHRKKLSEVNKGRTHTEETKKKISESNKGKTRTEEARKKMSEAHKGKKLSEETRKKMSESQKNAWLDLERKKKASESRKGKAVVIFKNNEYLNEFSSITKAASTLEKTVGGKLMDGVSSMLNNNWVPKRGRLKNYSAMYLSDYEKLQEDQLKIS